MIYPIRPAAFVNTPRLGWAVMDKVYPIGVATEIITFEDFFFVVNPFLVRNSKLSILTTITFPNLWTSTVFTVS